MKRILQLLLFITLMPLCGESFAQSCEISMFGGYTFPLRTRIENGNAYIYGDANYGGMFSLNLPQDFDVELMYMRSDTRAAINSTLMPHQTIPLSFNYIQAGFLRNFDLNNNDVVRPFVGAGAGTVIIVPRDDFQDVWFFSVSACLGSKFYVNEHLGFRVQASLQMPVQGVGADIFIGSGGGGSGLSLYSTILQFGLNAGLTFRFGGK